MSDGTGLAEALLGLDGFRILGVTEGAAEVVITIETTAAVVGCNSCGVRAESQDRWPSPSVIWPASAGRPGWFG